jgi:hypothetical protein
MCKVVGVHGIIFYQEEAGELTGPKAYDMKTYSIWHSRPGIVRLP